MKKLLLLVIVMMAAFLTGSAQKLIHGALQAGSAPNKLDVVFNPTYNSESGENILYISISVAIPTSAATGVSATIASVGLFSGMTLTPAGSYTTPTETVYSWVYGGAPTSPTVFTTGNSFVGATITFSGGVGTSKVRLVDFTNYDPSGGNNFNTYWLVYMNKDIQDRTDYAAMFYSIPGATGSTPGTYPNGDQYVETNGTISMGSCNPNPTAGTVSGTSPLNIGATATYTSSGDAGGAWSSSNTAIATVNASSGLVTAVSAGTTDITYTVSTGCNGPVSAVKTLTVNPSANAGTVSGTSPLCIGATATYTTTGTTGGTWSSTNTAVATVNASSGLVTAVSAGTTDITYTVSGLSSLKTLTVSPNVSAGTVSGTSPLTVGGTDTYTSNGTAGGAWGSSNTAVATVNASTGLVTAVAPGTSNITYTVSSGCGSPASAFKALTVNAPTTAGTVSGTSPLCIGATATYTSDGTAGGSWSSSNTAVATVNASSGLVTAVSAGTSNITYTVSGASAFKALTVSPSVSAGVVSGTSPLNIGATATYTSNGTAGGSWSSSNTAVATVNSSTGLVTAVSAGTSNITYTVGSGCGSPVSAFIVLTVNQPSSAGTVSGTSPLCIGSTATYSSNGDTGGAWSSSNTSVATVDAGTGLVTALAAGNTNITYTVNGASAFKALTVSPNVSAGTVNGTSPLTVGATATYTSSGGTAGGSWSSSNTAIATINASTGLVTAVSVGTTTITYTVSSGCGNPVSASKDLQVDSVTNNNCKHDRIKPTIDCPGNIRTAVASGCSKTIQVPNPVYGDNCKVSRVIWAMIGATNAISPLNGINFVGTRKFNVGVTRVIYLITDAAGNVATCWFFVIVEDNIKPTINCHGNITQSANGRNCSKQINVSKPSFNDNCRISKLTWAMTGATKGKSSFFGINYVGSKKFNAGVTTITYTVEDCYGNRNSCSFKVTVNCNKNNDVASNTDLIDVISDKLEVNAFPNPAATNFNLRIKSTNQQEVVIRISDLTGRLVQQLKGAPGSSFQFGDRFVPGTYMMEVRQGSERVLRKLIKY